ncbi:hypothetical protein F7O44_09170 [Phytoactinopolyspora sp. XMNu-373]|uniref:HTH luxR-type domain-containing protein n=2 Tax=Phytoactinopolyspora mesophila TaxID=2650750 RepID=A0A7K3M480_9ACTN|nr:hypothetical protein [Phytoactinopolyspora mesophila]
MAFAAEAAREALAGHDRALVVEITAAETEHDWPYSGVQLVLSTVLGSMTPEHREQRERGIQQIIDGLDADTKPSIVARKLEGELTQTDAPAIALIDDAHLLDSQSQDVLGFLARRVGPYPVGLMMSSRDVEPLPPVLDGLPRLRLFDLEHGDAVELLVTHHPDLVEPVAAELISRVRGHPRTLLALAAQMSPEQRSGQVQLERYLPVPAELRARMQAGLTDMTEAQRQALLMAVISEDQMVEPVLAALGGPDQDVARWLSRNHLDVNDGLFQLRWPLAGSIIWQDADIVERMYAHSLLAREYQKIAPDQAFWHEARARLEHDEGLAGELERVAREQADRAELGRAGAFARESVRLSVETGPRVRRVLLAGRLAVFAGRCGEALKLLHEASHSDLSAEQMDELALLEARARLVSTGEVPTELIASHAERMSETDPDRAARFWLVAACGFADRLEPVEAAGYLDRTEPHLSKVTERTRASYHRAAAWVASLSGRLSLAAELIGGAARECSVFAEADRCLRTAMVLTRLERYEEARRMLRVITDERRFGDESIVVGYAYVVAVVNEIRAGRLNAAERAAENWQRNVGAGRADRGPVPAYMIRAYALMGQRDKAEECRALTEALARRRGDGWTTGVLHAGVGAMHLAYGQPNEAMSALERARDHALKYDDPSVLPVEPDFVEACVAVGETELARQVLAEYEVRVAAVPTTWARHTLARCQALVLGDDADELFAAALRTGIEDISPVEVARTQTHYGWLLRRLGRRTEAAGWLQRAVVLANEAGAAQLVNQAEKGLGGGVSPGAGGDNGGSVSLTSSEQKVAQLVAAGWRNREIAAELYVSIRTVESHLGRVFRKLGVRSRAELARLVAISEE